MRPPFREDDPVILHGAPATPRRVTAPPTHLVPATLANDLRPDTAFAPGAPVEVDPNPPSGSTSAPLIHVPGLEATVNLAKKAALATSAVIMLSACESAPVATTTNTPTAQLPSSTAAPADNARDKATDAYRQMWTDFAEAGRTSDWQSPRLSYHATGIALNKLSQSLYGDNYRGLITKGDPVLSPSVTTAEPPDEPTKIIITDCGDSTNWLKYRKDNGALADDKPGGHHLINSTVEKQADGSWKVSDYGVHDAGSC